MALPTTQTSELTRRVRTTRICRADHLHASHLVQTVIRTTQVPPGVISRPALPIRCKRSRAGVLAATGDSESQGK